MSLQLDGVHKLQRQEGTNRMILVGKSPYTRFTQEGCFPVIIQRGTFYTDGGDKIPFNEVPDWVWDRASKMTPEGRASVGLVMPDEEAPAPQEESAQNLNGPDVMLDLVDQIYSLNVNDDAHWTKGGLPDLNVLKERMGMYISRAEVEEAAPDFRRAEK